MKNLSLNSSIKILNKTFLITIITTLLLPLFFFVYLNFGVDNYLDKSNYYKVVVSKGKEDVKRIVPFDKPITNTETTKDWLQMAMIDLTSYDAGDYNSKERRQKIEKIIAPNFFRSFWSKDLERIESDIQKGYLRSSGIAYLEPVLIGSMVSPEGETIWKFFLEVQIKMESRYESFPRYYKRYVQVIVKEIDPRISSSGIGIVKIDIK